MVPSLSPCRIAQRMHEKNLEMKHLREVMEKKMKDQLVSDCLFACGVFQ
jgi:hypothetical protein